MKILIAEDDSGFALILSRTLKKIGHTVTVARDGLEAWAALQRESFSLVISDWMMPGLEGPVLCERIRARKDVPYTYIILLTSRCEHQDRIDGLYSGADDFLSKPLEYGELFARLEIAQRILTMQEDLKKREEETHRLNDRLQQQNEQITLTNQFLEISNQRFEELFQSLPVACYAYDLNGQVHDWNRAAVDLFGYQANEVNGRAISSLVPEIAGEQSRQDRMLRILAGEAQAGMEVQTKTQAGVPLDLLSHAIPVRGAEGQITGIICVDVDITMRRAHEQANAAHLRQMINLNTELEQFASIACHDLQEPLRKIQIFNSQLVGQYGDTFGSQVIDYVSRIHAATERMQALIRDLFALTQVDRAETSFLSALMDRSTQMDENRAIF